MVLNTPYLPYNKNNIQAPEANGLPRVTDVDRPDLTLWFSPEENHISRSLSGHCNCETAPICGAGLEAAMGSPGVSEATPAIA
jgi:hypothetical protein